MLSFIEHAHQRGAQLVLVGDPEQLQLINAGTPLREIANKVGHADLIEIRRQKRDWQNKPHWILHKTVQAMPFKLRPNIARWLKPNVRWQNEPASHLCCDDPAQGECETVY
ncbi:MAG: AAA family ATPase [Arenicella sp.]|nr:AAA family ATPase [Arenicella sp.]